MVAAAVVLRSTIRVPIPVLTILARDVVGLSNPGKETPKPPPTPIPMLRLFFSRAGGGMGEGGDRSWLAVRSPKLRW